MSKRKGFYSPVTCPICKEPVDVEKMGEYGPGISAIKAMSDHFYWHKHFDPNYKEAEQFKAEGRGGK